MTEAEWLACEQLPRMTQFLGRQLSRRKTNLYQFALCRLFWQMSHPVEEDRTDNWRIIEEMEEHPEQPANGIYTYGQVEAMLYFSEAAEMNNVSRPEEAAIVRDVVGNPFRPVLVTPAWLTSNIINLAQATYEDRIAPNPKNPGWLILDQSRLVILADALEDAGCTSADILNHCRQPGEHVRGCWVVDLVIGKT